MNGVCLYSVNIIPNDYINQLDSERPNLIRIKEFISEECMSVQSVRQCLQLYTS